MQGDEMPTAIDGLEAHLSALVRTKGDMQHLRSHVAALEDVLEELSAANTSLQHRLQSKEDLAEKRMQRVQAQQERIFALESEAMAMDSLPTLNSPNCSILFVKTPLTY